jgi:hypothetical protein
MNADLYSMIQDNIERLGRSVISVGTIRPFSYTIGNAMKGLPELFVIGLAPISAAGMLNAWSKRMIDRDGPFLDGEEVDLGGAFPCRAIACRGSVRDEYTIQAGQFLRREDYDVVQMLVPDQAGRFPGDPLCAKPYADVPVLSMVKS